MPKGRLAIKHSDVISVVFSSEREESNAPDHVQRRSLMCQATFAATQRPAGQSRELSPVNSVTRRAESVSKNVHLTEPVLPNTRCHPPCSVHCTTLSFCSTAECESPPAACRIGKHCAVSEEPSAGRHISYSAAKLIDAFWSLRFPYCYGFANAPERESATRRSETSTPSPCHIRAMREN